MKYPPTDKVAHLGAGLTALVVLAPLGLLLGVLAALVLGVWKEERDERDNATAADLELPLPHEVSYADIAWTVVPAALGACWLALTTDLRWVAL